MNAVRAEECDDVKARPPIRNQVYPPPLLLQSRYIQPSPSGHRGRPPPLTVPCPPLPRVDGAMEKPDGGLLHPTLVIEQCKRWRCLEWADRHGLVLIQRGKFIPPLLLLLLPPPKIMRMPRGELPAGRPRAAAAAARPTTV